MKTTNLLTFAALVAVAALFATCEGNKSDENQTENETSQDSIQQAPTTSDTGRVIINECDPNAKQWELYNAEACDVDLSGWTMYKDNEREEASTFVFPEGATIIAGKFLTLTRNEKGSPTFGMSPDKGFKYELYNAQDPPALVNVFDNLGENIINSNVASGHTLGRITDGEDSIVTFSTGTIGATNAGGVIREPVVVDSSVDYSSLLINEVDGNAKFVEIYNKGASPVSLAGVTLRKNGDDVWWTGAGETEIAAGGYYAIYQSGQGSAGDNVEQTGKSGISPKKTLKFTLESPSGELIDTFARLKAGSDELDTNCTPDYGSGTPYSFSRCPDGAAEGFSLAASTPASANGESQGEIATN
jgi:hypothetical protein